MAREDLLANLLTQLTFKETPPQSDDNTLIQKMIAPNDTMQMDDVNSGGLTFTVLNPTTFKWGGYPANVIDSTASEVGTFEDSLGGSGGSGGSIVSVARPDTGQIVRAILLPSGNNVPVKNSAVLPTLLGNTDYVIAFDCWTDSATNGVRFDSDIYLTVAPNSDIRNLPTINGNKQVQHVWWTFNTSQLTTLQNQQLRFFNDTVQPNPSNIWITNVKLITGNKDYAYISPGWKWNQGQYKST